MAIITDLKDAISKAIYKIDTEINFNFNEIKKVDFPYLFLYFPSFKIDKAIDCDYWRKLTLMCVLEHQKKEENTTAELWQYADIMAKMMKCFDFIDTKISAKDIEFKIVDDVLQMTFGLEFYVKEIDETGLMEELNLTLK